ncbi:hypothetical protein [Paraburkholderia kururiensis]|uniref:Uncharacterized protein n=1 Tax=Paraburkholderia kururiensis TaxID=984307 RepID=A0ABZ0WVG0_9BURK|nr:hypothetical protein [Paraburkholderia kururiensis]WQD81246.1 hypothetical protein U0042_25135 [Paraburkholderia kururiensis]
MLKAQAPNVRRHVRPIFLFNGLDMLISRIPMMMWCDVTMSAGNEPNKISANRYALFDGKLIGAHAMTFPKLRSSLCDFPSRALRKGLGATVPFNHAASGHGAARAPASFRAIPFF